MTIKKRAAAVSTALLLLFAGCSNLDDTTDLGSGFVKNQDNFDVEEFVDINDSILLYGSFQDATDSMAPAITYNSNLSTGRFEDMRTVSYLEFNNDTLFKLIGDIVGDGGAIDSFRLKIDLDTGKSSTNNAFLELGTSYLNNHLDKFDESNSQNITVAFANTSNSTDSGSSISFKLDTSFFHYNVVIDTFSHDTIINNKTVTIIDSMIHSDTTFINSFKDTNTEFSITGLKFTQIFQSQDSVRILDSLETMTIYDTLTSNAVHYLHGIDAYKTLHYIDTLYIVKKKQDSTVVSSSKIYPEQIDTNNFIDTLKKPIPLIEENVSYLTSITDTVHIDLKEAYDDTVSYSYLSSIYGDINYVLGDTIVATDSSFDSIIVDTIHFKPYQKILNSNISTIINSDGTESLDTNYLHIENYKDIKVTKITEIVTKDTLTGLASKINDTSFWFIDTIYKDNKPEKGIEKIDTLKNFSFYIKQLSDLENSLQFYNNPRIEVFYSIKDSNGTVTSTNTKTLVPSYRNYSILEDDEATLKQTAIVTGAADRMMSMKLDLSQLWDSMRDSVDSAIIYQNIPKLDIKLVMDTAIYHTKSTPRQSDTSAYITFFYYRASEDPVSTLWDQTLNNGDGGQISRSKSDTIWLDDINDKSGDTAVFEIDGYVQDILNKHEILGTEVPNEIYLTVWLHDNSFTKVFFDTTSFDMDFIISNLKEDDE